MTYKKAECIRRVINNSSKSNFYKFDKTTYNASKIKQYLEKNSPKLSHLMNKIKELDENDMSKYGKNFKHIIYSDFRSSIAGIKLVASVFKAYGMNNIYNEKLKIIIPKSNDNFALLSSVALYNKPFPVKLRNDIIKIFNERPDNIYGENIRFLLIDQGFKEGIDCFDVKYVHLFDDLISPADQKQAIGRGTRFCGQKGLEFNPDIGWPLHVFKYKLILNENFQAKYNETDAFMLFIKEEHIDIKKLFFAAELENICRFGAVDYEINKAIHEFGNEKEDNLNKEEVFEKFEGFRNFEIKDMYQSLDKKDNQDFALIKKAYKNFGGVGIIKKKKNRFIDINKVKSIGIDLKKKLDFIEMRKYIRKYYKDLKWKDLEFKNGCLNNGEIVKSRFATLNNSQNFVSEYFKSSSIYKGILFWHSVGTGKTCSAIATASKSFERDGYTILWITRHTLKPDIWKNMYNLICSSTIKEKIENGVNIPENIKGNYLKYLDNRWVMPISYKQFSNLVAGKNEFYKMLVKRNGKDDPLKKTLIIIDEAHKLFAEDTPAAEKPNIYLLKKAIYNSYNYSKDDSCKLLLMTATPYTNDPIQLFKLLNLLRTDDYFPEDFNDFKDLYLDDNYKFRKDNGEHKIFLDKITGYISYLNREKDARQFAYPIIYPEEVIMSSSNNNLILNIYKDFMDDIELYINYDLERTKEILLDFKELLKEDKKNLKKTNLDITQEEGFIECMSDKNKKSDDIDDPKIKIKEMNDFIKEMLKNVKEKEKELKKENKKVNNNDEEFDIIDKTEKFISHELFYHIDTIINNYNKGEDLKKIGIRVPSKEFEDFESLGEAIIDFELENGILIKNTKKECILDVDNIRFTITHKKDKKFVIYILTPTIKNKNENYEIIDIDDSGITNVLYSHMKKIMKNGENLKKIGIRVPIKEFKKFNEFKYLGKDIIEFASVGKEIKNSDNVCIIDIEKVRFSIIYKNNKDFVIYILIPTFLKNISSPKKDISSPKKDISSPKKDISSPKPPKKDISSPKHLIKYINNDFIIPMDHSLNKKQVEKYINACDLETRQFLRKLFDNTLHVSFENFIKQLNKNLKHLISLTDNKKKLLFFIRDEFKIKSNYWIFIYIKNYFKINHPEYVLDLIDNLNNCDDNDYIILLDDCIYSGTQMGDIILNLLNINNKQLNFYLLCSYITSIGLNIIKFNYIENSSIVNNCNLIINNYVINPTIIQDVLTEPEIEIFKKYLLYNGIDKLSLIYFDHKLADTISTITYIYSGFVLNKKNIAIIKNTTNYKNNYKFYLHNNINDFKDADYIPVINNCQNSKNINFAKPSCPITPYKESFNDFIKDFKSNNIKFKSSPLKSKKKRILNKSI
jgi:superfamily II DNA or RNA helicase